jgi:hypothetical protein
MKEMRPCTERQKLIYGGTLKSEPNLIPLQVSPVYRPTLLRHPAYRRRDDVDLCAEATEYIQGRIPVLDRAVAIAILLERDGKR